MRYNNEDAQTISAKSTAYTSGINTREFIPDIATETHNKPPQPELTVTAFCTTPYPSQYCLPGKYQNT